MAEPHYLRQEHAAIAQALRRLRSGFLLQSRCWFAGGTAIVMTNGEYRLSLDIDFLCSDRDGYRALREFRCDQYGLRTALELDGRAMKFEIVREGRIDLTGAIDPGLGCPLLGIDDQFAEKLLANSDRGRDPSSCYRDAFNLGVLIIRNGGRIPAGAAVKAVTAYGGDIWRDARRVVEALRHRPAEGDRAADALRMDRDLARAAMAALGDEVDRVAPPSPDHIAFRT